MKKFDFNIIDRYLFEFSFIYRKKSLIVAAFVSENLLSASFDSIYMKNTTAASAGRSPNVNCLKPSHNLKLEETSFIFLMLSYK